MKTSNHAVWVAGIKEPAIDTFGALNEILSAARCNYVMAILISLYISMYESRSFLTSLKHNTASNQT